MIQNSIDILLGMAISRIQKAKDAKKSGQPSIALKFEQIVRPSDKQCSIILSTASAAVLQQRMREQAPVVANQIMSSQPFDEIREGFLLADDSLDNERLLEASQELPSEEAGQLLLLGVERAHLEVQLLDFGDQCELETEFMERLEYIEEEIKEIAAKLDPDTLLLKE